MNKIIILIIMLVVFCSFTTAVCDTTALAAGTVAYYKLEENNFNYVDEVSGLDFNTGNIPDRVSGKLDFGQDFDGLTDVLNTSTSITLENTKPFFISFWYYPKDLSTNRDIINIIDGTTQNGWRIGQKDDGKIQSSFYNSGSQDQWRTNALSINTWYHVLCKWGTTSNDPECFIDSSSSGSLSGNTISDVAYSGSNRLTIGSGSTWANVKGIIDEFAYGNIDISTDCIDYLYNGGSPTNLQQYDYPFSTPDNNITITLDYPLNQSYFYGDYNGIISVNLTNVNGTAECDINNTNWIENGSTYGNETIYFINNNVTGNNQSIIVNCSDLDNEYEINFWFYQENVINITFYNEETLQIMNGTNISIDFVSSLGTSNASTTTGTYSTTYFPLGDVEIQFTAPGYVIRQNYFTLFPGKQYSIDLYLINESKVTQVLFEIRDEFGDPVEGFRIKTMRRINGIYYLIETSKTNWQGLADFYGLLSTPMYYWIIVDDYDNVYKQTGESEIYATTLPFSVVLTEPIGHLYQTHGDLIYTLTFDNATNKFTYNYIDTSDSCTEARITVRKFPSNTFVATNYSTVTTGILTIDLNNIYDNGSTYMATATMNYSPSTYIDSKSYSYPVVPFVMGNYGIFLTVFIVIIIAFSGLWNPAVMFILEGIAFFVTRSVNLHHLSYTATISILIICLISAFLVSDRT